MDIVSDRLGLYLVGRQRLEVHTRSAFDLIGRVCLGPLTPGLSNLEPEGDSICCEVKMGFGLSLNFHPRPILVRGSLENKKIYNSKPFH